MRRVSIVSRNVMQDSVGIMHRDVKRRTTNQGREPRHGLGVRSSRIEFFPKNRQTLVEKSISNFQRVAGNIKTRPVFSEADAEIFQCLMPLFVWSWTGPNPLHA